MIPLEPLYTLAEAVDLLPYPAGVGALSDWLYRHRAQFPRRYQRRRHSNVRLLTVSELRRIRRMLVKEIPPPRQSAAPKHRAKAPRDAELA